MFLIDVGDSRIGTAPGCRIHISPLSKGIERHRWAATELFARSVRKVELPLLLDEAVQPNVVYADEQNVPG